MPSESISLISNAVKDALFKQDTNESFIWLPPRNIDALHSMRVDPEVNAHTTLLDDAISDIERAEQLLCSAKIRLQSRRHDIDAALTPVNVLPPEVLRSIFSLCLRMDGIFPKDPARAVAARLSHVSRRWRDITLGQRELWSAMDNSWKFDLVHCWRSRSGADGFTKVNLNVFAHDPSILMARPEDIQNWRLLHLRLPLYSVQRPIQLEDLGVNLEPLEELAIFSDKNWSLPPGGLSHGLPRLRTLYLSGSIDTFPEQTFRDSLVNIRLTTYPGPNVGDIAALQSQCPALRTLHTGIGSFHPVTLPIKSRVVLRLQIFGLKRRRQVSYQAYLENTSLEVWSNYPLMTRSKMMTRFSSLNVHEPS